MQAEASNSPQRRCYLACCVLVVAYNGVSNELAMHPYLMGTPRFRGRTHQCGIGEALLCRKSRERGLALIRNPHDAFVFAKGVFKKRGFYFA